MQMYESTWRVSQTVRWHLEGSFEELRKECQEEGRIMGVTAVGATEAAADPQALVFSSGHWPYC